MQTHRVLLITTGGTIAGEVAVNKKEGKEIRTSDEFSEMISPTLTTLKNIWDVDVEIDHLPLRINDEIVEVDSSDIVPEHWIEMSDLIKKKYDEYESFIITHGTNTLGYTCAALSFALVNPNKPIVLTGSQVPLGMPGSDAMTNLNNALRVAVWPYEPQLKGVVAVFGSHIITGTRVKKSTEFDYDAFVTFTSGSIGRIGRIINFSKDNLLKHNNYLAQKGRWNCALTAGELICENKFDMRIASLTEFPGMSPNIITNLADSDFVEGIIFRAFGAGDVSHRLHDSFRYAKAQGIPIVVTTQAPNGNSNFQVNEPGQHLKNANLAIPAYDMSIESQTAKLAWLLAKKAKGKITYDDIKDKMLEDMHGEIDVLLEFRQ